jgi:CheY-like chemotaxis protein
MIDMHPANTDLVNSFLRKCGHEVEHAGTGREGIEKARTWDPQVILLDSRMTDMSGFEVIRSLRSDRRTNHIGILAVTGIAVPGEKERYIQAGADGYFSKPFSLENLESEIDALVRIWQMHNMLNN